jgi:hypothetical protein
MISLLDKFPRLSIALLVAALPGTAALAQDYSVTAQNLSVRSCGAVDCGRLGLLRFDTPVTVRELQDGWARISDAYDAECADGVTPLVDSGNAACNAENGIVDGQLSEWVSATYLTPIEAAVALPEEDAPPADVDVDVDVDAGADAGAEVDPDMPPTEPDETGDDPGTPSEAPGAAEAPRLPEETDLARLVECASDFMLYQRHLAAMRDLREPVAPADLRAVSDGVSAMTGLLNGMLADDAAATLSQLPRPAARFAHAENVVRVGLEGARQILAERITICSQEFQVAAVD